MKLSLEPVNGRPFCCMPAREVDLDLDRIRCNNLGPILPGEYNPHDVRLYVVGNEFGAMGAVWSDSESDAFNELVDADLAGGILIDESDAEEDSPRLGNAGEPANLDYAWIQPVRLDWNLDGRLLAAFAEVRASGGNSLDDSSLAHWMKV